MITKIHVIFVLVVLLSISIVDARRDIFWPENPKCFEDGSITFSIDAPYENRVETRKIDVWVKYLGFEDQKEYKLDGDWSKRSIVSEVATFSSPRGSLNYSGDYEIRLIYTDNPICYPFNEKGQNCDLTLKVPDCVGYSKYDCDISNIEIESCYNIGDYVHLKFSGLNKNQFTKLTKENFMYEIDSEKKLLSNTKLPEGAEISKTGDDSYLFKMNTEEFGNIKSITVYVDKCLNKEKVLCKVKEEQEITKSSTSSASGSGVIPFGATQTHQIGGVIYQIKLSSSNTASKTCSFWIWKGTGKMYDTTYREKADSLSSGQSYNFVTLPLTLTVNSCNPGDSADYTLTSGGKAPSCQDECSNHNERWCVGNKIYGCLYLDGCWVEGNMDVCSSDEECVDGYCAKKDETKSEEEPIVAVVNDRVITLNEFNKKWESLSKEYGEVVTKDSFLEEFITNNILLQEANQLGVGGPNEQGIINNLLNKNVFKNIEPTETELRDYFESKKFIDSDGNPISFEENKEEIKAHFISNKKQELYEDYIEELKAKSNIEIFENILKGKAQEIATPNATPTEIPKTLNFKKSLLYLSGIIILIVVVLSVVKLNKSGVLSKRKKKKVKEPKKEEKEEIKKETKKLPFNPNIDKVISVSNFTLKAGKHVILENVSLEVNKGEMVCLLGPSGTGKSTVIESLVGRKTPTKGVLKILGENVAKNKKIFDYVGFVPQHAELYTSQTVMQNLLNSATKWGIKDAKNKAEKILLKIGLSNRKDLKASKLSGGQQKLLSLGMELIRDIEVCILDEPTTGLDPNTRNNIITILSHISTQLHKTILFTTHFMDDAEECDKVIILADKKIVVQGPPSKLEKMLPGGGKVVNIILDNVTDDLLKKIEKIDGVKKIVREGRNLRILTDEPNAIKLGRKIDEIGGVVNETKIDRATMMEVFVYNTGEKPDDKK